MTLVHATAATFWRRPFIAWSAATGRPFALPPVAITYEEMGLLATYKHSNWFDPGRFWSGDTLPLADGYRLGDEIAVAVN